LGSSPWDFALNAILAKALGINGGAVLSMYSFGHNGFVINSIPAYWLQFIICRFK
jgi:hypothetical protein